MFVELPARRKADINLRKVDWLTLYAEFIAGYAGVMIGIKCSLSRGFLDGSQTYECFRDVICSCSSLLFSKSYTYLKSESLVLHNRREHYRSGPFPLTVEKEKFRKQRRGQRMWIQLTHPCDEYRVVHATEKA